LRTINIFQTDVQLFQQTDGMATFICIINRYQRLHGTFGESVLFWTQDKSKKYKVEEDEVGGICGTNGGEEERV
jgi:hypothetical protein